MKQFEFQINGYDIIANYDENDIANIYKPLLNHWYDLYKEKKHRIIVYIVGCPGSGKSTFVSFLEYLFNEMNFNCQLQTVGMDGFHYYNDVLEKKGLKKEKGSPKTFNVNKLKQKIIQTKEQDCFWPTYSRNIHNPIENQVFINGDIILIEGNYLLLNEEPWNELRDLCDDSLFIDVNKDELKERLIDRKARGKISREKAIQFYNNSDKLNIETVINKSYQANLNLRISNNKVC